MEVNQIVAPPPPPPPAPGYKRIVQTSRRLSYVNFGLKWFNNELLSDIEIYSDLKSNGNSSSFRCHQFVLYLNSPELLEGIQKCPYEGNNTRKYVIIEELRSKAKETELFLKSLYDPLDRDSYDSFNSIFTKYNIKRFDNGLQIAQEILPQRNSETKLSDIKLKIKDTEDYFSCHRLFLAHNSEYFSGLFSSDMKDSNTNQSEISSSMLSQQEINENIGLFLESLYYGEIALYPIGNTDKLFAGHILAQQYLLKNRDRWLEHIKKCMKMTENIAKIISNALRYDMDDILTATVPDLFLNAVQVVNSEGFEEIPNEYLEQVVDSKATINLLQACLKSGSVFDSPCIDAVKKLTSKLGANSPINFQCVDNDKNTCLHLACLEPKPKTLKYLLKQPSVLSLIDEKNNADLTAIQLCLQLRYERKGYGANFDTSHLKLNQECFSILLAHGASLKVNDDTQKMNLLALLAAYSTSDPTFSTAKEIMESSIDLEKRTDLSDYGINVALALNNEAMMEYYFIKKGLTYTMNGSQDVTNKFGNGSIADDRDIWTRQQYIEPLNITVKDKSIRIDSKPVDMKGAKYYWTKRPYRSFISNSYEAHTTIDEETTFVLHANGGLWEMIADEGSALANFIIFFVHLHNPGYKEEKPEIFLSDSSSTIASENTILDVTQSLPETDPKEFVQKIVLTCQLQLRLILRRRKSKFLSEF